ncbi:DMT family transporter [Rhizobium daejeonense]|uniref:DMT family transporter n=1 Tax=Rhizobium daejeonense TaxID=240521 RepID=A0A6M1RU42_9HYPH|nr:DMT family transporter [Rhizobium daejeonense]
MVTESSTTPSRHNIHATGREKLKAHLAVLLFSILIAGSFSFGGIATQLIDPIALQALRYALTVLLIGLLCFKMGLSLQWPKEPWRFAILGALMAVYMVTMFIALQFTKPVATGAIFTLMPLLSAGFGWLLMRQRTRPGVFLSLLIAATGAIWVIFRGDINALMAFDVGRGEMIFFIGVLCHAAYVPLLRLFNRKEPPLTFVFWAAAATFLFITIPATPRLPQVDLLHLPSIVWLAIVYLSVITTALTFFLLQYASMRLPAPKVLAYGYLTPTFIIVIEGLIGHGWASAPVFLGALVTACGLLVMALLPD